jgi:hypothetical protein
MDRQTSIREVTTLVFSWNNVNAQTVCAFVVELSHSIPFINTVNCLIAVSIIDAQLTAPPICGWPQMCPIIQSNSSETLPVNPQTGIVGD